MVLPPVTGVRKDLFYGADVSSGFFDMHRLILMQGLEMVVMPNSVMDKMSRHLREDGISERGERGRRGGTTGHQHLLLFAGYACPLTGLQHALVVTHMPVSPPLMPPPHRGYRLRVPRGPHRGVTRPTGVEAVHLRVPRHVELGAQQRQDGTEDAELLTNTRPQYMPSQVAALHEGVDAAEDAERLPAEERGESKMTQEVLHLAAGEGAAPLE